MYLCELCCVLNCFNLFVIKVRYSRVIANVTVASRLLHSQRWHSLDLDSVDCALMVKGQKKQALLEQTVKRARSALTLAQISRDRNDDQGKTDQEAKINKHDMTILTSCAMRTRLCFRST